MEQMNKDFNVPYYLLEDIVQYVELTVKVHCNSSKLDNIKALLGMAKVNNRLS